MVGKHRVSEQALEEGQQGRKQWGKSSCGI